MTAKENIADELSYIDSIKPKVNELQDFVTDAATGYNEGARETPEYYIKMLGVVMEIKRTLEDYEGYLKLEKRSL